MSAVVLSPKLVDQLKALASERVPTDDKNFEAYSWCGGNADDAVSIGENCGRTEFARTLCDELGIDYEIDPEEGGEEE